ncbi:hypothetical protein [Dactylosporangium sp. NPDC049140]|uniref:hypothetical protein n=1 Tax=Dactylosporangium sp. NPDC049140 TaxID=3155647 RepID=UPI0033FB96D0
MALCLGVPLGFVAVPVIRDTLAASRGSNSPQEALLSFTFTFDSPANDTLTAERYIVRSHRKTMLRQRADYIAAIEATNAKIQAQGQAARLAEASGATYPATIDIHGDHANVSMYWQAQVDFANPKIGGAIGYQTDGKPWTATADHERDGWRLASLTMPPWCGTLNGDGTTTGYLKC